MRYSWLSKMSMVCDEKRNQREQGVVSTMAEVSERLQRLFYPHSVVFVGASNKPDKWGSIILANLINGGFKGLIYPVNPGETEIQGLTSYPSVTLVPGTPDLAVIVVPPGSVPHVIDECVAKGIRAGVVITAGFAEVGDDGHDLQREMVTRARDGGMLLVGPNCNGIMCPPANLYAAMPPVFPPPGQVAIVSQSGNVATSIARRVIKKGFGISCFVSSGNEADLHCEDFFRYLAKDPETRVILSYIEGFRDGKRFLEIAKEVTKKKPIIVLKAGSTSAGAKAAMSYTAALAGSDHAFEGLRRQAGIIRAKNIDDLTNVGVGFIHQPLPRGRQVAVLTAGGGWGVLAADACAKAGLEVPALPEETIAELDAFMPAWWNRGNPVDLVAALRPDHLWKASECLLRCSEIHGVILLGIMPVLPLRPLAPSASEQETENGIQEILRGIRDAFQNLVGLADRYHKPLIVASEFPTTAVDIESRMSGMLGKIGGVCYLRPEDAATAMAGLATYAEYIGLRGLDKDAHHHLQGRTPNALGGSKGSKPATASVSNPDTPLGG
jgi:acyl-CoA synthetase (NDP forming)